MIHSVLLLFVCGFAVTIGAHRYYTHRAFKATTTLRIIFVLLFSMSGQNTMWAWVRNHRQHHKYSDTDADPHNARRGFFFSHIGWFLCYKNPKVIHYGRQMNMRDLDADPFVKFQTLFFIEMYILLAIVIPCATQIYFWNEDPLKSFLVCYCARTCLALNLMCLVNSYAHTYGTKPYDNTILPGENKIISMITVGEGWHNYHHAFPWDYRTSELGTPHNWSTAVINYFIKKGWIYDVKTASEESIKKRILKTGDKSYEKYEDFANTNTISL
uniref:Fatty acid desaturase domain-containing protein n=2 Tax=Lutzomyia longipalpis TaxID=7200 RepID=A0A1B0GHQ9_LUTLO